MHIIQWFVFILEQGRIIEGTLHLILDSIKLLGRFKLKETDSVGFITKNHFSRYLNPIFMFFMSKNCV